jgi:type IV pilus assembly protein PilM
VEHLSAMKLSAQHVDVEPNALFRAYQRFLRRAEDASTVNVIIDVGLSTTKVIVSRGPVILFIKSIDVAGRKFNENVAKELNLTYQEALHIRRRGFSRPRGHAEPTPEQVQWSVYDAIRSQVEVLAREIGLCLRYCSVTFRGLRPAQLTVTGGEAYDPALIKLLSEYLNCPCVVGQPLHRIDLGESDLESDRRGAMTEWSVATGLALRGLFSTNTASASAGDRSRATPRLEGASAGAPGTRAEATTHERRRLSA